MSGSRLADFHFPSLFLHFAFSNNGIATANRFMTMKSSTGITRIKICGLTSLEDALAACTAGAHALGFNFSESSPRRISPENAREIVRGLPPFVSAVGVFVEQGPSEIDEICEYCGLHTAQLHSERYDASEARSIRKARVLKVFRAGPEFRMEEVRDFSEQTGISDFLFDAYQAGRPGGTGKRIDEGAARKIFAAVQEIGTGTLAGGLNPGNVGDAIRALHPYAVDTASGVESAPGVKDRKKMQSFVRAVQLADAALPNT